MATEPKRRERPPEKRGPGAGTFYDNDGLIAGNELQGSALSIPSFAESIPIEVTDLLRDLLDATRVRAIAGFKPGRCLACNRPHPANMNLCKCPCHKARELLAKLGIEVAA